MIPDSIDDLVSLNDSDVLSETNFKFDFPDKLLEQIVFEVIYNIRKHAISLYMDKIKANKLKISLRVKDCFRVKYLSIANNYCDYSVNADMLNKKLKGIKVDGINLIYHILHNAKIGDVFVETNKNGDDDASLNEFVINIPLKISNTESR
jgi:hypothetical protein